MGSPPAELSLDYKPNAYSINQKPSIGDQHDQTQKLQEFLGRLEEERLKIEAFKRELPLCMQLLTNAVETYRQQLETYHQSSQGARPVLEEFIPLKNASTDGSGRPPNAPSEKASWMVSAQLWSPANHVAKQQTQAAAPKETERAFDVSPKLALDTKQRNGRAFLPFSKEKSKSGSTASRVLPDLALASPEKETEGKLYPKLENGGPGVKRENCSKSGGAAEQGKGASTATEGQAGTQAHRKARRCWSPDLHRRFVNALQILGGSQVATPKQIRELMKVDGLTNDEVKSHLQKYRLHTRRPIQAPQAATTAAPQLVVLGGIWVPPEYATSAAAAAAAAPAIYGAHPSPAHYCTGPMPQDFYPAPQPHHHPLHSPLHRTAAAAMQYKTRLGSPESDMRSSGELSESIEEEEEGEEREEEDEDEEIEEAKGEDKAMMVVRAEVGDGGGEDVALKF